MLVTISTDDDRPPLIKVIAWPYLFETFGGFWTTSFWDVQKPDAPKS